MTYTTLGTSGEFLAYPTNKVVGVFAEWGQARQAIDGLSAAGFTSEQIGVLYGSEGARRLDATGERHGFFAQLSRLFQCFSDMDEQHTLRHEQELKAGHVLVSVDAVDESKREEARRLMKDAGGYFINFYGKWHVENLEA